MLEERNTEDCGHHHGTWNSPHQCPAAERHPLEIKGRENTDSSLQLSVVKAAKYFENKAQELSFNVKGFIFYSIITCSKILKKLCQREIQLTGEI